MLRAPPCDLLFLYCAKHSHVVLLTMFNHHRYLFSFISFNFLAIQMVTCMQIYINISKYMKMEKKFFVGFLHILNHAKDSLQSEFD